MSTKDIKTQTLAELATHIRNDWKKVNFAAVPYLDSLSTIDTIKDEGYGFDMPNQQIAYFLSNAGSWRGDAARTIKAELNRRIK